jgi:hypothetical protein
MPSKLSLLTDFTPINLTTFMHPNLTDLHYPKTPESNEKSNENRFDYVRRLTSHLLADLQLFYKSSENNLTDCFSHAAGFVGNSRSANHFWVHREGGSK